MVLLAGLVAVLLGFGAAASVFAQSSGDPCKADNKHDTDSYATIRLVNMTQPREAMEITTGLRNMLPCAKVYYVAPQNAITVSASAQTLELARKLVAELDQPIKSYRVTFTLTEVEAGKRLAGRKFSMVLSVGERSTLKLGQRVPIVVGADKKDSSTGVQVQYVDIGLNLQANIEGKRITSKVEESSLVNSATAVSAQDPTIAQTVLEGSSPVKLGVPVVIGSLEVSGSSRRQEVEVLVEATD
jgi:type II secretory pathway component GspD/PulD (secretin)